MQSYTVASGASASHSNSVITPSASEEVLIYGVPASKLLDPTANRALPKPRNWPNRPVPGLIVQGLVHASRSVLDQDPVIVTVIDMGRDSDRDRGYDRHRSSHRRRSHSRSGEETPS